MNPYDTCICGCQSWEWLEDVETGVRSWYCKRCGRKHPHSRKHTHK